MYNTLSLDEVEEVSQEAYDDQWEELRALGARGAFDHLEPLPDDEELTLSPTALDDTFTEALYGVAP